MLKIKWHWNGILDLYNKEKEKNIPLIIDEKSINEYANELEDLLKINDGQPVYFSIKERQAIHILSHYVRYSVSKSKLKEFFSSRLEKYCEADDGMYQQDYLIRGELELVDRYKECRELAKIILEEDIEPEVPQDCLKKDIIREEVKKLNKKIEEYKEYEKQGKETDVDYYTNIGNEIARDILNKMLGE